VCVWRGWEGGFREMMVGGGDQGKVAGVGKAGREGGRIKGEERKTKRKKIKLFFIFK